MFLKDKTIAMFPYWMMVGELEDIYKNGGNALNWDMAVQPTFAGVNSQVDSHYLMVGSSSKYKKQSFEVIKYLAYDKEAQLNVAKQGRIPALQDQDLLKDFASDLSSFKGKRFFEVLSKNKMNKSHVHTKYDNSVAAKHLNLASNRILKEGIDINTAIREAVEATDIELTSLTK